MRFVVAVVLLAAAAHAWAQNAPAPMVDAKAFPTLSAMMEALRNGSEASRYCARTGGLYLEADALLRKNMTERDVVDSIAAKGKGQMSAPELTRLRQLADGVTQLAAGFKALAPESSAVAYTQTCLASTRAAPGTRNQQELNERFADALACDKRFQPGSLEGKECVAKAFHYR